MGQESTGDGEVRLHPAPSLVYSDVMELLGLGLGLGLSKKRGLSKSGKLRAAVEG